MKKINNIKLKLLLSIILLLSLFGVSYSSYIAPTVINNPQVGDSLVFDGINFANTNSTRTTINFLDDTAIIPAGAGPQTIPLKTLLLIPNTIPTVTDTVTVNSNTLLLDSYLFNFALNGTSIQAGIWQFDTYCSVSNTGNTTTILTEIYDVKSGLSDTITITGIGTSRTATTTSGTPFAAGDANVDATLSGYLTTPNGNFQITAFGGTNTVTIATLSTYTNEITVIYYVHKRLFENVTAPIKDTTITLYTNQNTQSTFTIDTTDKLAARYFARTLASANRIVSMTHNGSSQYTHFHIPVIVP